CRNQITHTQLEFASVLKCLEGVFGLDNINSRDATAIDACAGTGTLASNGDGMVDLNQRPIPAIGQTSNPTTTSVQTSVNPSSYGLQVSFTANVTSASGAPSGTVTFQDAGVPIGSQSLSQGSASMSRSDLLGGTHSITAVYGGDPVFGSSTSAVLSQVINPSASTTILQSSQNPSSYGQAVTFTATVSGGGITPTGDVTFYDGAAALGTSTVNSGRATLTTSSLSAGSHSITGSYGGDSNYSPSTSAALAQTVNKSATSTTVTSSLNPSVYNQSVAFTATVSGAGGLPTGLVTFNDGTATMGSASLVNGVATLHYSSLAAGPHNITASYSGDPNFQPSTSAPLPQTVKRASTSTALVSDLNPSYANQSVTFTATMTSNYGGAVSGTVTFKQGTAPLSTVPLTNGQASYSTSFAVVTTYSITATYSGDSNNLISTASAVSQVVQPAPTTTALTTSKTPSFVQQAVTFTATVTSPYGAIPNGEPVTFFDGGNTLGSSPLAGGIATYTTSSLMTGNHTIKASYPGNATFNSSSNVVSQVVNRYATTTALSSNHNPSNYGQSVTFTAKVTSTHGPIPNGELVTFLDGTATLASVPLNSGVASYTTSSLKVASHTIKVAYVGDAIYASSSRSIVQAVKADPTTMVLSSSLNPSHNGQSVTLTSTL